jgi:hypothetical protein
MAPIPVQTGTTATRTVVTESELRGSIGGEEDSEDEDEQENISDDEDDPVFQKTVSIY